MTETVSNFLLDCPRHMTLRQQLFFSLLDIPETISLNLLIFGSVNLNDVENKAVFKSVQTMIKVWTDLNTALFSSSFRLTEPKISRFSEIVSGMSKSEKKSCCLRVM
jgi:hypothetical protein